MGFYISAESHRKKRSKVLCVCSMGNYADEMVVQNRTCARSPGTNQSEKPWENTQAVGNSICDMVVLNFKASPRNKHADLPRAHGLGRADEE